MSFSENAFVKNQNYSPCFLNDKNNKYEVDVDYQDNQDCIDNQEYKESCSSIKKYFDFKNLKEDNESNGLKTNTKLIKSKGDSDGYLNKENIDISNISTTSTNKHNMHFNNHSNNIKLNTQYMSKSCYLSNNNNNKTKLNINSSDYSYDCSSINRNTLKKLSSEDIELLKIEEERMKVRESKEINKRNVRAVFKSNDIACVAPTKLTLINSFNLSVNKKRNNDMLNNKRDKSKILASNKSNNKNNTNAKSGSVNISITKNSMKMTLKPSFKQNYTTNIRNSDSNNLANTNANSNTNSSNFRDKMKIYNKGLTQKIKLKNQKLSNSNQVIPEEGIKLNIKNPIGINNNYYSENYINNSNINNNIESDIIDLSFDNSISNTNTNKNSNVTKPNNNDLKLKENDTDISDLSNSLSRFCSISDNNNKTSYSPNRIINANINSKNNNKSREVSKSPKYQKSYSIRNHFNSRNDDNRNSNNEISKGKNQYVSYNLHSNIENSYNNISNICSNNNDNLTNYSKSEISNNRNNTNSNTNHINNINKIDLSEFNSSRAFQHMNKLKNEIYSNLTNNTNAVNTEGSSFSNRTKNLRTNTNNYSLHNMTESTSRLMNTYSSRNNNKNNSKKDSNIVDFQSAVNALKKMKQ